MDAPVDPAALANALQALTAALQTLQANPPAAPAAAAHVNILGAFESIHHFYLGYRAGSYAFAKASAPLEKTWNGTIEQFPSFIISLHIRESKVCWNAPAPQGILDINGSNLLTDYHSLTILQVDNASAARVDPHATQNACAMYSCLKSSISGDLKLTLFPQVGNLPTHEDGTRLFAQLTTFTIAASLHISMDSFKRILEFDPSDNAFNITTINTKLNHLFVLATTGKRILGETERIQHTLTAYALIKQLKKWAQSVRLQIDRIEEGIITNAQSLKNSAALKFVKILANGSDSFGGSSTTISKDIVYMMDAVSKKRTAPPTSKKKIATKIW